MHHPHPSTTLKNQREKNQVCKKSVDLLLDLFSIPPQQLRQVDLVAPPAKHSVQQVFLTTWEKKPAGCDDAWYGRPTAKIKNTASLLAKVDNHVAQENSVQELRPIRSHVLWGFLYTPDSFLITKILIIFAGQKLDKWKVFIPLPSSPGRFWGSRCQLFCAFDEAHLVRGLAFFWHSTEK